MKRFLLLGIAALLLVACGATPTPEIILVDRDTGEIIESDPGPPPRSSDCHDAATYAYWDGMGDIYEEMSGVLSASLDADDVSDASIRAVIDSQERGLRQMQALNPPACAVRLNSLQIQQIGYFLEGYRAILDIDADAAEYWWEKGQSLEPQIDAEWDKIEATSSLETVIY